jgi:hypothetical protein
MKKIFLGIIVIWLIFICFHSISDLYIFTFSGANTHNNVENATIFSNSNLVFDFAYLVLSLWILNAIFKKRTLPKFVLILWWLLIILDSIDTFVFWIRNNLLAPIIFLLPVLSLILNIMAGIFIYQNLINKPASLPERPRL